MMERHSLHVSTIRGSHSLQVITATGSKLKPLPAGQYIEGEITAYGGATLGSHFAGEYHKMKPL